jgi:YHS domain-containing protein
MAVAVLDSTETTTYAGVSYYFCCAGCRERFERDPTPYVEEVHTR